MKLIPSQIEQIEWYLLSKDLTVKSFYDEILDHFICKVEVGMDRGMGFHQAFFEAQEFFHKQKSGEPIFAPKGGGLKAMENAFLRKLSLKGHQYVNKDLKKYFGFSLVAVAVSLAGVILLISPYFDVILPLLRPLSLALFVIFVIFLVFFIYISRKRQRFFNNATRADLQAQKSRQLGDFEELYSYPSTIFYPWVVAWLISFFFERFMNTSFTSSFVLGYRVWFGVLCVVIFSLLMVKFFKSKYQFINE